MSTPYFDFRRFRIRHDRCAMKVGTDAVLLGAWADVTKAKNILDIGCGSGLITIMAAQRNPTATLTGIEIETNAAGQAQASDPQLSAVLRDILDTPVSPELLPAVKGEISQRTEDLVGPYELHDFFLYYMLRWGFSPAKIYRLALYALEKKYSRDVILKWLKVFYRRFFSQQFKRNCLPDGPKVGSVAMSPRGDWRMPSDASWAVWKAELETLE